MFTRVRSAAALVAAGCLSLVGFAAVLPADAAPGHDQIVSAVPSAITPAVNDGEVDAIVQVGSTVVVGGTFSSVTPDGGSAQTRNYIFAFNASTGALVSGFHPTLNGDVNDLVAGPTDGTVFVGGSFNQVNGAAASHVTLLNVSTGQVVGNFRAASTNGVVNTLVYHAPRLYVGGNFTTAGGIAHGGLASLNPTTGALDSYVSNQVSIRHNDSGSGAQGAVGVRDLDVNADGSRLVAIGNFKKVDGLSRDQLVMLSLGGSAATVTADWATTRYSPYCFNWAFDTYVRGVSFSPDGSFFVVAATGGQNAGTLCDTAARFETNASGSDVQPTWVDYTGGDTVWAVTVTEKAVYVGGHQRWLNNSQGSDYAGPGAVPRPGLAALDLNTGMPLKWNPGRNPRGAAVFALYATPQGLWLGSDTDWIGNYQYKRPKLAFFPLAGGDPEAGDATPALPGTAYVGGRLGQNGNVLYRVNAAGPTVGAADAGPDWAGDDPGIQYHNSGSNIATYSSGASVDSTVPATTPNAVFDSERWSPSDDPAMNWDFPVQAGVPLQVRLYFANRCSCTSGVGQRVFDVSIDGRTVLDHFDIVAAAGDQTGTMRSFDLTSDGDVDIDFHHEVENPLVNAIEIVRTDQAPPTSDSSLTSIPITASGADAGVSVDSDSVDWGSVRGSFLAGGKLYYGLSDGTFDSRTYDGSRFGAKTVIDPYHDPVWDGVYNGSGSNYDGSPSSFYSEITSVTGMAYADGRLYYHLTGQSGLYWRWFNTDSGVVGADRFAVSTGVNFGSTMGMFLTGGTLYYVDKSDGSLNAVGLNGTATSGTPTVVDSPTAGGNDWRARALFLAGANTPPPDVPPTASFTVTCVELNCTFDASGSTDSDGTIAGYAWTFGDGGTATGQVATHQFASGGSYDVTLVVTDDRNGTDQLTKTAQPTDPVQPSGDIEFDGGSSASATSTSPRITIPAQIQAGDLLVMTAVLNADADVASPSGWTRLDRASTIGTATYVWTRRATAGDAGSAQTVTLPSTLKSVLSVVAYSGVATDEPVAGYATGTDSGTASHTSPTLTAPSTSTIVSVWTDKGASTSAWTAPAGVTRRVDGFSSGTGRVSSLIADSSAPGDGQAGGLTATTDATSSRGVSWTIALNPVTTGGGGDGGGDGGGGLPPAPGAIDFVGQATAAANSADPSLSVPGSVASGDLMVLTGTVGSATSATDPSGWTLLDTKATTGLTTYVWTRRADAGDAGSRVTVPLDATAKSTLALVAYGGADPSAPVVAKATAVDSSTASHQTPTVDAGGGDLVLSYWADKSPSTSAWDAPSSVEVRASQVSTGSGRVSSLVADSAVPANGQAGGLTATTDAVSTRGISWTIVLGAEEE